MNEETVVGTPLLHRPDWSARVGRVMAFPPLAQNLTRVVRALEVATSKGEVPEWEMGVLQAAERVRELYEGDAAHARLDWSILTDPDRMDDEAGANLSLLAEAATVDATPILPPPGIPNASNRMTQATIDNEWDRIAGLLWPGLDSGQALEAQLVFIADVLQDVFRERPKVLDEVNGWIASMAGLAAKVAKEKSLPLWLAAWRVAVAVQTLSDEPDEVATRVAEDDDDPDVNRVQDQLHFPMDLLRLADDGVIALTRVIADPNDESGDGHVLITKPLLEAVFVGRDMTDDECVALMGDDPSAAYGTLEAIVRLACQQGASGRNPLTIAMALDRWWSEIPIP